MDFSQFKELILMLLGSGVIYFLKGMKESVDQLNIQIAVIIKTTDSHEKRLDKLEEKNA